MDEIDELRSALHRDPRQVAAAASALAASADSDGDLVRLSRVLAVLGRARRSLGEIELAESELDRAIAAAMACGDGDLAADAHLGMAGVLSLAGRPADALAHLDTADRLGSDRTRAYVALQRAIINQRIGHMAEALASYESALPVLRAADSRVDVAMVLVNRGVIRIQAGECEAAIADLSEARRLYEAEQHDFGVARALHGLGWAYARYGDVPGALRHLDLASEQFQRLGHTALDVDVDRVEVLIAAGLSERAAEEAVATAKSLYAAGNHSLAAEAWMLCGRAALLAGDRAAGAAYARRAREMFAAQGSPGWERTARLEVCLTAVDAGDVSELRTLADELGTAGNARGAATALALAAVAACDHGDVPQAEELSDRCAQLATRLGIFEVRMSAAYAQARYALLRGDEAAATRHLRAGTNDLHRHRASFAATDARAAVSAHAARIADLGLRLALRRGSAPAVLEWMERARAGRAYPRPARPPQDPALAAELAELRAVVARLRSREAAGGDATDLLHAQRDLERRVHRRHLRSAGDGAAIGLVPVTASQLRETVDGRRVVALAEADDRLAGVGLDGRRSRLADLGPAADSAGIAATIMSCLRTLATPASSATVRRSSRDLLGRAAGALDRVLAPVLVGDGPVVLVVPASLHTVPWQLLPSLAGQAVAVAPSATWWHQTATAAPLERTGPVLAVAGPRLREADREAVDAAGSYPGATVLTGAAATTGAVLAALGEAPVAHVACHGRIRYDNPLWSSLELHDGPLYVHDVERLARTPPVVVLSGCSTGVGVRAGDELLGLATALLAHGTASLVASVCPLPDSAGLRDVMTALHRRIAAGTAPADALAELSTHARNDDDGLVAASLGCFGTTG